MKGKWDITSQYLGGAKIFQVYRLRDANEVDHCGNREYADGTFTNCEEAVKLADKLNKEE